MGLPCGFDQQEDTQRGNATLRGEDGVDGTTVSFLLSLAMEMKKQEEEKAKKEKEQVKKANEEEQARWAEWRKWMGLASSTSSSAGKRRLFRELRLSALPSHEHPCHVPSQKKMITYTGSKSQDAEFDGAGYQEVGLG